MEYTKDVIYNVKYSKIFGILNLKRKGIFNKIKKIIIENKFITTVIISIAILTVIDIALVNAFMNIFITTF